jgi:hypothetical protein
MINRVVSEKSQEWFQEVPEGTTRLKQDCLALSGNFYLTAQYWWRLEPSSSVDVIAFRMWRDSYVPFGVDGRLTTIAAERAFSRLWDTPEEDEAWADL